MLNIFKKKTGKHEFEVVNYNEAYHSQDWKCKKCDEFVHCREDELYLFEDGCE